MAVDPLVVILGFGVFPPEHTCDGDDTSPAITILGARTPYLAIIMEDIDAPEGTFTHWLIWNIPATEEVPPDLPAAGELQEPAGAMQGTNDYGTIGYRGPCPLRGESHRYLFRVYGLAGPIDLAPGSSRVDLGRAMMDAIQESGEAMAAYGRAAETGPPRC
ncbi:MULTISPECIES: YbhB/YbcL family Raf kinase inhibitor-like protein [unclassified Methanoculleus]|uniref:YbhB/YbcL family Raf kinase inhibitor-like protein n=1 Tax=unclassified Methanoculleus TaxID=2619537 RepID=UPI0025D2431B|nr:MULTISPECIES: YbhB/YbcL family Raf kinase inhibitor-like protein [unclassified Methanoculleus]MCK9318200.1 YbhB/YbcL family Raf kinase inhibitor-like protein [Methanoculleus sp.]MDD2254595.1 YbhB/YbcL family Raf kinase inhibitor-like protein [Methanoculleus sp.]MDD2786837.1 YbhB/YbcL family Raf kinase inhibitor-like protein [Methanoculleus sp.]MDD3216281.1 YbhB/YbcL family Raf kinase inhibitor-like protein [Methanoculleus sp.]MDD4314808.1 YbhB/YbcL family Raf kinase inhibitor-like protein [